WRRPALAKREPKRARGIDPSEHRDSLPQIWSQQALLVPLVALLRQEENEICPSPLSMETFLNSHRSIESLVEVLVADPYLNVRVGRILPLDDNICAPAFVARHFTVHSLDREQISWRSTEEPLGESPPLGIRNQLGEPVR